jgi:predicted nucleic acid-binding protein
VAASQAPVISNTTPLINLVGVRHLDLLPALYGTITIANAVHNEYVAGKSPADPDLGALTWLHIAPDVPRHVSLPPQLGAGEAATLSLALAVNARAVLLDEAYGRRIAQALGLPVVGTLGVLLAAKQAGHLPAVGPVIDDMIRQGRRISQRLRAQLLRAAGESP